MESAVGSFTRSIRGWAVVPRPERPRETTTATRRDATSCGASRRFVRSGIKPASPGIGPALSGVEPTLPGIEPALPGIEPTLPGIKPTLPGVQPALPGIEPT